MHPTAEKCLVFPARPPQDPADGTSVCTRVTQNVHLTSFLEFALSVANCASVASPEIHLTMIFCIVAENEQGLSVYYVA